MTTLFDLTLQLARLIGEPREGVSTGGSSTTLVDTTLSEPADYFNSGILFVRSGTLNGTYMKITDSTANGTLTFGTQSGTIAAGVSYTACGPRFPQDILAMKVSEAARSIPFMAEDSSLAIVEDQEEYSLPSGVGRVRSVEYGEANAWTEQRAWRETNGTLRFLDDLPNGNGTIRIRYEKFMAAMDAASDVLDPQLDVSRDRIVVQAALDALQWRYQRVGDDEPETVQLLNKYTQEAQRYRRLYPAPTEAKQANYARW